MSSKYTKNKRRDYIFVLWSDQFEELAATVFVTQLREAGLRVKLVSLARKRITGIHGLMLHPDFTLEQARTLARRAIGVIIPCGLPGCKQLENDPRLPDFLSEAYQSGAQFVIGQELNRTNSVDLNHLSSEKENVMIYPDDDEELIGFARELAISLSYAC